MKCEYCSNQKLIKIDRRTEMAELDDEATDGQMADYFAAELSGDFGAWNIGLVSYCCPRCGRIYEIISDELKNYWPLIQSWHEKAQEGDYFSRFVFEYLAFIAHLKNNLFIGASTDRRAIQLLKQSRDQKEFYLQTIEEDGSLFEIWQSVITELNQNPLHNTSHDLDSPEIDNWWNNSGANLDGNDLSPKGLIRSPEDWGNMVEFWYGVRNNLFHGGKDPNIQRDRFLVEHAYRTLTIFMENEIRGGYQSTSPTVS